jgi:dipeptidyl aminopeptidase/acylaminoacyl peptidase
VPERSLETLACLDHRAKYPDAECPAQDRDTSFKNVAPLSPKAPPAHLPADAGSRCGLSTRSRHAVIAVALLGIAMAGVAACGRPSRPQEVSFATADGGTVVADLYAARGPDAVLLAHGAAFDKASWTPLATWLADRGHRVLAIDFRGYGGSTAGKDPRALFEDVLAGVRYLHRHGAARVAVLGASMGGGAVAEAATRAGSGEIDRMILLSPMPISHPERLRGRLLFVASQKEPMVARMTEQYRRAGEPKRLLLLPGAAHGQYVFATDQAERLRTAIAEFLDVDGQRRAGGM